MATQSVKRVRNVIAFAFAVIFMFFISGCATVVSDSAEPFGRDKLPKQRYLVGGGLEINWTAPADGTAYIVKRGPGGNKLLSTEWLAVGGTFVFSVDVNNREVIEQFEKVIGCKIGEAEFSLYFVSSTKRNEGAKTDCSTLNSTFKSQ